MNKDINKIKGYRNMLGLSQRDMAEKFGISLQAYNSKENGKTAFNDSEKYIIKNMLIPYFPNITIDEIFFKNEVK